MHKGKISTFFSFKGGVGRSMTMANIAYILSSWGYKVLCIDGDLEAPGLYYYFGAQENATSDGFLELLLSQKGNHKIKLESIIKTIKVNDFNIDFIYSGKTNNEYPKKLQELDIDKLYSKYNFGLKIEDVFGELRQKYDHILIDSRTGFTDIGAMLSIQLPDQLFLFCTTNHQGLFGIDEIAKKVTTSRSDLPIDKSKIVIVPIISSFAGMFEKALGEKWLNDFINKLGYLFDDWRSPDTDLRGLINELIIPFIPAWSFGENLPVSHEDWDNKDNISYSFRNLASLLANDFTNNALFVKSPKIYSSLLNKNDFFISYTGADEQFASWIAWTLEEAGYSIVFHSWDSLVAGRSTISEIDQSIKKCDRIISIISQEYLKSSFTKKEWEAAIHSDPTGELGLLIPVIIRNCTIDGILKRLSYISLIGLNEKEAKKILIQEINKIAKQNPQHNKKRNQTKHKPRFPESLPSVWNIPHRNPNFIGREDILNNIRASFKQESNIACTQQVLCGLAGIGKSQIATEYAYRNSALYEYVWWIRAEEESILIADYLAFASEIGFQKKDLLDQKSIIKTVLKWFDAHGDWLVIFDNATDYDSIKNYLPRSVNGHILITSRYNLWKNFATLIAIFVWTRSESIIFLQKRTGLLDIEGANALSQALGDLPLALEQAAAYCDATKKSFSDYLILFNTRRLELWSREKAPDGYTDTVSTSWLLALEEIRRVPLAEEVLSLCSIISYDKIPKKLIEKALQFLVSQKSEKDILDEFAIDDAYHILLSYSLIDFKENTLSLHRLVQAVVRDQMNEDILYMYRDVMIHALSEQFPRNGKSDPFCWPKCELLFPHAQEVLSNEILNHNVSLLDLALLLNNMGLYLHGRGAYQKAEPLFKRSLKIREMQLGQNHPDVAVGLNNLALLLTDEGKYAEAEPLVRRALKIGEEQLGPDHPDVAVGLNNLALLLTDEGKYAEAEPLFKRSLKIREMQLGQNHPDVAVGLNNLALLLTNEGKYAEAEPLVRRALKIVEAQLGPDHPDVATALNNFAFLLQAQGKYAQAEPFIRRALVIYEKQLGSEHPFVANSLNNLALLLQAQGMDAEAEPLFKRVLEIRQK